MTQKLRIIAISSAALASQMLGSGAAFSAEPAGGPETLADLSLEQLAEIKVFSASRYMEPTNGLPAAIFVLTGEDLLRSGVTSVPEALRLVPGVQVGRVDGNKWAVSMRGFNSREANKLLVLVDGRSVYDPLFSGMLWEAHDLLLEDIERIEVIRGPGGTLWGANAFNGVINIITRRADSTHGMLASLTAGDEDRYIAAMRYGWNLGDGQDARVYAKASERDTGYSAELAPADAARDVRAGFRWDFTGARDELRVSADVFDAKSGVRESAALAYDALHRGRNVLAQWGRQGAGDGGMRLQLYYDHVDYDSVGFAQERDTYDLEFQQTVAPAARQLVVWGAAYRRSHDHALSKVSGFVDVLPARRTDVQSALFVQDTLGLVPDTLALTAGIKYESTDYADAEWLPSVRLAWTPTAEQTWWAAISEATRVPSRLEADLTFFETIRIGDEFGAEKVRAYEAGHRRLVSAGLWYDVAFFYNDYDELRTTEAGGQLANLMHGRTAGAELALRWEPLPRLRVDGAYTYLDMDLRLYPQSTSNPGVVSLHEGLVSRHQLAVRAVVEIGRNLGLDATARYVDDLTAIAVPAYTQLDLALTWRPRPAWKLSLVGSDLLDSHHPEQDFAFSATGLRTEVERAVYLRAAWQR